jgi:hypothetical protein
MKPVMRVFRRFSGSFCLLLLFPILLPAAPAPQGTPFCADSECAQTREFFKQLCDYIVKEKTTYPVIFISGYYMRTLVAGYEILGERRYLDAAVESADGLLKKQNPQGYWPTGYGGIELADTGSALGLLSVLYKHVDKDRQEKYVSAVQHYFNAIEKDGLILPSSALGYGWATNCAHSGHSHCAPSGGLESEEMTALRNGAYTTASCLTGGEGFTWMYHVTKEDKYRRVAYNSLRWVLSTMRKDGVIPYVAGDEGVFWEKQGDPANDFRLWDRVPNLNSAYLGEGLLSFDLHCDQPEWKADLRGEIKPHIEWLLRTQNANGSWGIRDNRTKSECDAVFDPTRSPGIANLLIWYYEQVDQDPRIVGAVRKFDQFLLNPEEAKAFGLLNMGAPSSRGCEAWDAVTSLSGYALSDILVPEISSKW